MAIMVKVRQLVGRQAGEIIELEQSIAESCIACGTAAVPGEEPVVRGTKFDKPLPNAMVPEELKAAAAPEEPKAETEVQPDLEPEEAAPEAATEPEEAIEAEGEADEAAVDQEASEEAAAEEEAEESSEIEIPEDWRSLNGNTRRQIAGQIYGESVSTASEADVIIAAHLGEDITEDE